MKGLVIEGFLLLREGPRIRVALLHMKMWFISNVFDLMCIICRYVLKLVSFSF